MKYKNKWILTAFFFSVASIGYSQPEVTTSWSENVPNPNQSIESVQQEMNAGLSGDNVPDNANQVFQQQQNRTVTLPSNPELSDEALAYLTFCNEQLPNQLQAKYGARFLSA